MIVFLPSTWPSTFGISNLSELELTTFTSLYAFFRRSSYDAIGLNRDCV